ncbi:MAG: hypothetical protein GY749_29170 [Desulfobacteraceae bacterium]|nr:hypothetical protein [Desulfobacteraceae bacterium]
MNNRLKPYKKYKNSGIEWIGEIPAHWEVRKLKYVASVNPSNIDKNSKKNESEVFLCNYVDVYKNDFITNQIDFMKATATKEQIRKFLLQKGDIILTKDSETPDDIGVPALVAESFENVVCGYHLTHIKPKKVTDSYLFWQFRCKFQQSYFEISANGVTRYGLGVGKFNSALILLPTELEQQKISNYLNRKSKQANTFIEKQTRFIELLKEQKKGIINNAVTKGLNYDVPMKDSGVEWIGEIPAHWEVKRLGKVIRLQRGVDITKNEQHQGNIPVISSGGISSCHNKSTSKGPGVIVGRKGSVGKVHYAEADYWAHDTTLYVKEFNGNNPRYIYYLLSIMDLERFDTGSSNPTLNRNIVHPEYVPCPSKEDQKEIALYIDKKSEKITQAIIQAEKEITLVKEYLQSLIYQVVTGRLAIDN